MTTNQPASTNNLRKLTQEEFIDIITLKDKEKYSEFYGRYIHYTRAIIIKDVAVDSIQLTDSLVVSLPIIIVNGLFKKFRIIGGVFQEEFRIIGGVFQQEFRIDGGEFQKNFTIDGGEFHDDFWIEGENFKQNFTVTGGVFQEEFRIVGGVFQQVFRIDGGEFQKNFTIDGGEFQKIFIIEGGKFGKVFTIEGGEFQEVFTIEGGEFQSITFVMGLISFLSISHLTPKVEFNIGSNFTINQLILAATIPKDTLIKFENQLYFLSFTNVQNFGLLVLNGFSFKKKWSHPKDVTSSENPSSASPQLTIENSDLGKMTFINSDLSGFDLVFRSSKITEVFVTGTKMPRHITTTDKNNQPDYQQHQLGYSQIKKIYEARGDRIEANRYFALEMEAYRNTLSSKGDFWEKLNLNLNRFSTNYGQSWERGLWTTLLVSGLFYLLYCLFLGFLPYWPIYLPTWSALKQFGTILSYFLEFINPIHKADYIAQQLLGERSPISGWARTVEGISRIFIAYFVYQLIQAFRKHGKSSG